ncbi:aldose 1-epimerase [Paenibacillus nasutitermitis]|uniref:Galactose mutarotase n=1 Tax=Paenibacillus nasutitermitis TaxID=1652958 RepID=A0A917DMT0_9BACL|nr:aldose 1-epimerase [Paenibacillus nasutitermitis]GGD51711.1 galactose mutarotase [Paenibacillus nasutitermitis]
MSEPTAYKGNYQGEKAVWLKNGNYEAAILPEIGANLIAFRDSANGYAFLHEPTQDEMESFKARPFIHGIPVLFPPNRFEDGKFPWNGKTYTFPVNEEKTGNHLHGFVHSETWAVEDFGQSAQESFVTVALKVDEQHAVYRFLPHLFTIKLKYTLSAEGLSQHILILNDGEDVMPCLFAFHTSVNAPFAPGSEAADYRVKLTIGNRWELNERMLPTGKFQPLTVDEEQLKGEGVYPFFAEMDNHYTAVPQNGRNRMELTDTKLGRTLVYDVGTSYKQWMIWNNFATEGFFCPEPQVSLVNAPHVELPADEIGLFGLASGEIWEETARLYLK